MCEVLLTVCKMKNVERPPVLSAASPVLGCLMLGVAASLK